MRSSLCSFVLVLALLAGCCGKYPSSPAPQPSGSSDAPAGGDAEVVAALDIYPLKPATFKHQYVDGARKGQTFTWRLTRDADGLWSDTDEGAHTMFVREKDGAILVMREVDNEENVRIEYDPPLELLPAKLETGKPRETRCRMMVFDLSTGAQLEEGECVHVVEYLGRRKVRSAAGEVEVCRTRAVRKMKLKLAQVEVLIEIDAVPGLGKVRSRIERNTKPLGLFSVKTVEEVKRLP